MSSNPSVNFNYLLKYIIIGDSSVGKSNLLLRFTENSFKDDYQATIGVEFGAKNLKVKELIFRIQVWDTAGQENFRSITRAYYKNSVCALIVYDISKRESFQNIQSWISDCKAMAPKTVLLVLVGNKNDLDDSLRKVSFEEGKELAGNNNMIFFETSAKTGNNVEELFQKTAQEINNRIEKNFYDFNLDNIGIKQGINNTVTGNENFDLGNKSKNKKDGRCC